MTPENQRIAIATACGWKRDPVLDYNNNFGYMLVYVKDGDCRDQLSLPDYLNDLNAMHEAEKALVNTGNWIEYVKSLGRIFTRDLNGMGTWEIHCQRSENAVAHSIINYVQATPLQRAEAFLKTLGLWIAKN